ncbi:NAD-dependent deacetylase [Sulfurovum sp. zt1-1]|uniref:protein acetyllysine N-acetyltransferase n=1 Tax=Sulfurovum zhangzhouensis TaxID=3019067 RepID=A0ABT7QXV2_9BACT|nr:Sir2 family NAD-dependent protein deacetylase [Sulfurovum zhangzhouensis]MDM5271668.1 NAD-dependent deacetylase [Sulfurovum zhangzhouensis]
MNLEENIQQARKLLANADALFITAGAGMGVDSGLPDFRGVEGFWNAYPKARELNLYFEEMANPKWFESDPRLAWAFYGHRLHLYRDTVPHKGYTRLLELSYTKKYGSFVFTSNVDGQFQKAGFIEERIMECHGSIHHMQCLDDCRHEIWSSEGTTVEVGEGFKARDPLPNCPYCGGMARPNILMFSDWGWNYSRTDAQRDRLTTWIGKLREEGATLAIIEMGAGTAVPTVRNTSEQIAREFDVPLIRINPRESFGAEIELPLGAVEALEKIIP